MSNIIDATAAEAMPYGTYVEVGKDGYARPDPTFVCNGGVVKRPPGGRNQAEAGEAIKVETDGPIQMLIDGKNVPVTLQGGHLLDSVADLRRR